MSKLSKFLNSPSLFFRDAIAKRLEKNAFLPQKSKKKDLIFKSYQFNTFVSYTHLLYSGEGLNGVSHLDLWIPHFLKAEISFLVLVRNNDLFEILQKKYPQVTVLFAKGEKEVESFLKQLPFLQACFYPSNVGSNLHLLKFNMLKHIFIGHGDSDKTASAHKYFRVYDENWVAGEAHIDRFKNEGFDCSGLQQIKVGRPNLKETLQVAQKPWQTRFKGKINLLYLSTWEGVYKEQNYTSIYFINKFFGNTFLLSRFNEVAIKLHPWVGKRDISLLKIKDEIDKTLKEQDVDYKIHDKTMPVEDLIKGANLFICDISAVISESLAANAPIFVYVPDDKEIKLTKSKMSYEDYTYIYSSVDELLEKIEDVIINNNDYLADNREKAMEYILGKDETLNDVFITHLENIKVS